MTIFYERLLKETENARETLFTAPVFSRCFAGDLMLGEYQQFLTNAYHHVKHTVPLLMAVGSKLPDDKEWLREATAHYIEEEIGHQEWILNDLAVCGVNKEKVRYSKPNTETELMIAYAYDMVNRINPLGFFGMVHVLEGTSISTADAAADAIQNTLSLPNNAFTYLRSHGAIDKDHIQFFKGIMNKVTDQFDQDCIIHSAKVFFLLYGNIFRSITPNIHQQAA